MHVATLPRLLLAAALLLAVTVRAAEAPVPPLKSRVTDLTGTLTPDQRAAIEAKLATFETKKGSQVAVLIVPTIKPETIEQYSLRVVEQWKLGRKRVDDGAQDVSFLWRGLRRLLAIATADIVTTLVATAAVAPFAIYHFHRLSRYGVVANLIALPLVGLLIMPFALVGLLAMPFGLEAWPLVICGLLKILYDLALLWMFRHVRPPEEINRL